MGENNRKKRFMEAAALAAALFAMGTSAYFFDTSLKNKPDSTGLENIREDETVLAVRYLNEASGHEDMLQMIDKEGNCKYISLDEWQSDYIMDEDDLLEYMDECMADEMHPYCGNRMNISPDMLEAVISMEDFDLRGTGWERMDAGNKIYYSVCKTKDGRKLVRMQTDGNTILRSRYREVKDICKNMELLENPLWYEYTDTYKEWSSKEIAPSEVPYYAQIGFSDGDCEQMVTENICFENLAPEQLQISWKSQDESVVTHDGKVTRQQEDKKVNITANISYKEMYFKKKFTVIVKRKNIQDNEKLRVLTREQLDEMNMGNPHYEAEFGNDGYLKKLSGKCSDVKVDSSDTARTALYQMKTLLGIINPDTELKADGVFQNNNEYVYYFQKMYKGLEVLYNQIKMTVDKNGEVTKVESTCQPVSTETDTKPGMSIGDVWDYVSMKGYTVLMFDENQDVDEEIPPVVYNDSGTARTVWKLVCEEDKTGTYCVVLADIKTAEIVSVRYRDFNGEESLEKIRPDETVLAVHYTNDAWAHQDEILIVNKEGRCKLIDLSEVTMDGENLLMYMDLYMSDDRFPFMGKRLVLSQEQWDIVTSVEDFKLEEFESFCADAGYEDYYCVHGSGKDRRLVCMRQAGDYSSKSSCYDVEDICKKISRFTWFSSIMFCE